MFNFLRNLFLFKIFQPLLVAIRDFFVPDEYFSWKTMIYLSLFSWLMSWIAYGFEATRFTVTLLTSFSWLFLAFGVGWGLRAGNVRLFGIPLAPWVSGAILCAFIFGLIPGDQSNLGIVAWPIVSALIIIVPQFLTWDFDPKVPPPIARQQMILIFLLSLLLSSWLQFYMRLQSWFDDYPSLQAENFANSGFVYRVPGQTDALSEGVTLLTLTESALQQELDNRPWPGVERWLLNVDNQLVNLRREVRDRMTGPSLEQRFWRINVQPRTASNGYDLRVQAIWQGPTAEPRGYYLERSCRLSQVNRTAPTAPAPNTGLNPQTPSPTNNAVSTWSSLECDLQTERKPGRPA